jgi:inner membrane protein
MDSVSQAALGASVCYATIGPRLGKRALIIGALVGTLPDLDVLVPYEDAVASFTYHRSWSHSLFVLSLISLPVAWLIKQLNSIKHPENAPGNARGRISLGRWWLAIWLVLFTHALLDSFTIYGTQIWWPLPLPPVAIGSIFIIDPLYTLPLLITGWLAWRFTHKEAAATKRAHRFVLTGLAVSTAYLGWTLISQTITANRIQEQLRQQNIDYQKIVVAPFPTSLLWRIVVIDSDHYHETFASMLDDDNTPLMLTKFTSKRNSCGEELSDQSWALDRMEWFTGSAIAIDRKGDRLVISDLRMGIEDDYVFEFDVGGWADGAFKPAIAAQLPIDFDMKRMSSLLQRITDQQIRVSVPESSSPQTGVVAAGDSATNPPATAC